MAGHAAGLYPALSDPALYEHLDQGPPASEPELHAMFKRWESRHSADGQEHFLNWAIRLPAGELAGYVQATIFEPRTAWVAYVLGRPHWGRGLAQHSTAAMLDYLRRHHGCHRYLATVERNNRRSVALLNALAFRVATPPERALARLTASEALYLLHR